MRDLRAGLAVNVADVQLFEGVRVEAQLHEPANVDRYLKLTVT